jgi:hypothetical protein
VEARRGKPRQGKVNKEIYPRGLLPSGVLMLIQVQYEHVNSP